MKTGGSATEYCRRFIDWDSKYEGYDGRPCIKGISREEYERFRYQVDVELTLKFVRQGHYDIDDVKNHLEEMKKSISGIL